MKRYLLFSGQNYYAQGGWHDFIHDFDRLSDAVTAAENLSGQWEIPANDEGCWFFEFEWWHVIDTKTGVIVGSEYQAHGAPDLK